MPPPRFARVAEPLYDVLGTNYSSGVIRLGSLSVWLSSPIPLTEVSRGGADSIDLTEPFVMVVPSPGFGSVGAFVIPGPGLIDLGPVLPFLGRLLPVPISETTAGPPMSGAMGVMGVIPVPGVTGGSNSGGTGVNGATGTTEPTPGCGEPISGGVGLTGGIGPIPGTAGFTGGVTPIGGVTGTTVSARGGAGRTLPIPAPEAAGGVGVGLGAAAPSGPPCTKPGCTAINVPIIIAYFFIILVVSSHGRINPASRNRSLIKNHSWRREGQ